MFGADLVDEDDERTAGARPSGAREGDLHDQVGADGAGQREPERAAAARVRLVRLDSAPLGSGARRMSACAHAPLRARLLGGLLARRPPARLRLVRQVRAPLVRPRRTAASQLPRQRRHLRGILVLV